MKTRFKIQSTLQVELFENEKGIVQYDDRKL
jgi:hypothetical protein